MTNITTFEHVRAISEGGKELKVEINGEDFWVPKAQIHPDSEVKEALDEGSLIVNTFWAKKVKLVT